MLWVLLLLLLLFTQSQETLRSEGKVAYQEIHSIDKSLIEKVTILENLDEEERKGIYSIIDGLSTKQKLKQTLSNALAI